MPILGFWLLDVTSTYVGLQTSALHETGIIASKLLSTIGFIPYTLLYLSILWLLFFGIATAARKLKVRHGFYLLYFPIAAVLLSTTINNLILIFSL